SGRKQSAAGWLAPPLLRPSSSSKNSAQSPAAHAPQFPTEAALQYSSAPPAATVPCQNLRAEAGPHRSWCPPLCIAGAWAIARAPSASDCAFSPGHEFDCSVCSTEAWLAAWLPVPPHECRRKPTPLFSPLKPSPRSCLAAAGPFFAEPCFRDVSRLGKQTAIPRPVPATLSC